MGTGDSAARSASAAITVSTPAAFGQSRLDADDYVTGPPELVAEVAASSAAYDLRDKLRIRRQAENRRSPLIAWINPSNRPSKAHSCSS